MEFDVEWIGLVVFALIVVSRFLAARRDRAAGRESSPPPQRRQSVEDPLPGRIPVRAEEGDEPPRPIEPR